MTRQPSTAGVEHEVRASGAQEMRWRRGSAGELVNTVYRLRGQLARNALRYALGTVIERHEALRCSLHDERELTMRVHTSVATPLRYVGAQGGTSGERERWLTAWIAEEVSRPFDRSKAPLLRAALVCLDDHEHVLVIVMDHIISDGWSAEVLARELGVAYAAAIGGSTASPPPEVQQYPDWVTSERASATEARLTEREAFWKARFPGGVADVAVWLPGYRAVADGARSEPEVIGASIERDSVDGLRETARRLRVTLFGLTATLLVRLLQRDTGQERITLSTSSASRPSPRTAAMIGYLATTIWIPTTLGGMTELPAATQAFQNDLFETMAQDDVPAREVFERLWGSDARARMSVLPQVDFLCSPFLGGALVLPGIEVEADESDDGSADGALSVFLTDHGSRIDVQLRYMTGELADGYPRALLTDYVGELVSAAGQTAVGDSSSSRAE